MNGRTEAWIDWMEFAERFHSDDDHFPERPDADDDEPEFDIPETQELEIPL